MIDTKVQKAFKYIKEQLSINPSQDRHKLVDDASMRYLLSPPEAETLYKMLKKD